MNRKYLVFLDIDGVFTSNRVHVAHNGSYALWSRFDPVAVDFMNWIHDTHPVEFVIMSTWKNHLDSDDVNIKHWVVSAFYNSGFRGKIADPWKTYDSILNPREDRGHEVKSYLDCYGHDIEDYILFDDSKFNFKQVLGKGRHVLTDPENGLLFKHMLNAKSIMGEWTKLS